MKKLLADGFTTKIACPTGSFRVLVYPSGVDVSTSTLRYLSASAGDCAGYAADVSRRYT